MPSTGKLLPHPCSLRTSKGHRCLIETSLVLDLTASLIIAFVGRNPRRRGTHDKCVRGWRGPMMDWMDDHTPTNALQSGTGGDRERSPRGIQLGGKVTARKIGLWPTCSSSCYQFLSNTRVIRQPPKPLFPRRR